MDGLMPSTQYFHWGLLVLLVSNMFEWRMEITLAVDRVMVKIIQVFYSREFRCNQVCDDTEHHLPPSIYSHYNLIPQRKNTLGEKRINITVWYIYIF